jgi:hypothetical protein
MSDHQRHDAEGKYACGDQGPKGNCNLLGHGSSMADYLPSSNYLK